MPPSKASSSKHEYDKLRLKEQIDAAMQSFLTQGRAVERVAPLRIPDPVALIRVDSVVPEESLSAS